jgi:23S rRNA pseudoU1915 N3-methylase RlmH
MTESKFSPAKEKYLKRMQANSKGSEIKAARRANRLKAQKEYQEKRKRLHAEIDRTGPTLFAIDSQPVDLLSADPTGLALTGALLASSLGRRR